MVMLNTQDKQRYQRHLQLKDFGEDGQGKLKNATVLIVGIGGLGCPTAQYLVAAGVGELHLMDGDVVELSNLQRQPIFRESDIGVNKAIAAKQRLSELNSSINIHTFEQSLTYHNITQAFHGVDLVIDCTDNFSTRYLINDMCKRLKKPWIYGSVLGYEGQFALFHNVSNELKNTSNSPCFRCLFPEASNVPDCNQAGVLGVLPGIIGLQQATLALKFLSGSLNLRSTFLYLYSATHFQIKQIQLHSSVDCRACQGGGFSEADYLAMTDNGIDSKYKISSQGLSFITDDVDIEFVDVRSKEEYMGFNLGGVNLPLENWINNLKENMKYLRPNKTYIFYCQSGIRSEAAVNAIIDSGVIKDLTIKSLVGGLNTLRVVEE